MRGIAQVLQEGGKEIQALARDYAPHEDGYLRDAIRYEATRTGVNGRVRVVVDIDMGAPADRGKTVGDYAMYVHEHLAPYGDGAPYIHPWGNKSILVPGHALHGGGGKFMERAAEKVIPTIIGKAAEITRRKLG